MILSKQSVTSASAILIISTLLSNGLGIVREILLANYFGTNRQYDLFVLAQYLPSMINAAFFYGIPSVFVPLYYKIYEHKGKSDADRFQDEFFSVWMVIGLILCIICILITPLIIEGVFTHLTDVDADMLAWSTQVIITGTFASITFMIVRAILSAHKHFMYPAISMLSLNIIVIAVLLSYKDNSSITILSYTISLGMLVQCLFLFLLLYKKDRMPSIHLSSLSPEIKTTLVLAIPVLGIELLWGLFYYLDGYFASLLDTGNISVINYALVLFRFPNFLFGITIGAAILPTMSQSFSNNKIEEIRDKFMISIKMLFIVCFILTALFVFYGKEIIEIVFERGAFGKRSVEMTSMFLMYLAPSCFFLAGYPIILRMMSAVGKNIPMIMIFILGLCIKYFLFMVLFKDDGLKGLAYSVNISLAISFTLSLLYSQKSIMFDIKNISTFFGKNIMMLIALVLLASAIPKLVLMIMVVIFVVILNPVERKIFILRVRKISL